MAANRSIEWGKSFVSLFLHFFIFFLSGKPKKKKIHYNHFYLLSLVTEIEANSQILSSFNGSFFIEEYLIEGRIMNSEVNRSLLKMLTGCKFWMKTNFAIFILYGNTNQKNISFVYPQIIKSGIITCLYHSISANIFFGFPQINDVSEQEFQTKSFHNMKT